MTNPKDGELVEIGGLQFTVIDVPALHSGDEGFRMLLPYTPDGPADAFRSDGPFNRSLVAASKGISAHLLDVMDSNPSMEHLPKDSNEFGFSAAHLNLLGDDNFYPECWEVLKACGWAHNFGQVSEQTLAEVKMRDGEQITDLAKQTFGENWGCYILERASVYLCEPFTRPWYAANILSAYYARQDDILFGYLWAEYNLKLRVQQVATTGRKVFSATQKAADLTNARHASLRDRRFSRMSELVESLGVDKAAAQCDAEGLGNWEAIKRQWNRRMKKRDS